jgi:hypothetical protein
MKKIFIWCASVVPVGAVVLGAIATPPLRERLLLGPVNPERPPTALHSLSERVLTREFVANLSRFEFYPWASLTDTDNTLQEMAARPQGARDGEQSDLVTKPLPSRVPQPISVPHVFAKIPPSIPIDKIHALQRELKRLGCYMGQIDGAWGPDSRYAAVIFAQRVNLDLPPHKPYDTILARSRQRVAAVCAQNNPKS